MRMARRTQGVSEEHLEGVCFADMVQDVTNVSASLSPWPHLRVAFLYHIGYNHTKQGMILMIPRDVLMVLARKGRVEVIRTLRAFPDNDFSLNELARVAKLPTMTAWRGVRDLKAAGFVKTRRVGNSISVRMVEDREKMRILRLIPETDPQRAAAERYARELGRNHWLIECRLFGSIGRGEHAPGEEVDIAVVYDDAMLSENEAKAVARAVAEEVKVGTNVAIAPLLVPEKEMTRKGGLASELRDKEVIWRRQSSTRS